jgi:hypothetical protein
MEHAFFESGATSKIYCFSFRCFHLRLLGKMQDEKTFFFEDDAFSDFRCLKIRNPCLDEDLMQIFPHYYDVRIEEDE